MQIKRRDFLKAGVAAGAAVALTGPSLNAFAAKPASLAGEKSERQHRCRQMDTHHMSGLHTVVPGRSLCPERQGS